MAASMKDIKRRMKSVKSTMQITKAMELVAFSKLRKAKERVEKARPFFTILYDTMYELAANNRDFTSVYTVKRPVKKTGVIVIAGDRGFAGGYNSNVLKYALEIVKEKNAVVIPIGKKVSDYFTHRGVEVYNNKYHHAEDLYMEDAEDISQMITYMFRNGDIDELYIVYTKFVSMLSQEPSQLKVLPLNFDLPQSDDSIKPANTLYEPTPEELFDIIVPQYVSGIVFGATTESYASEQSARRIAMEAATDNADEIITELNLKFNRARQAAITQEISEIVSGADALK